MIYQCVSGIKRNLRIWDIFHLLASVAVKKVSITLKFKFSLLLFCIFYFWLVGGVFILVDIFFIFGNGNMRVYEMNFYFFGLSLRNVFGLPSNIMEVSILLLEISVISSQTYIYTFIIFTDIKLKQRKRRKYGNIYFNCSVAICVLYIVYNIMKWFNDICSQFLWDEGIV